MLNRNIYNKGEEKEIDDFLRKLAELCKEYKFQLLPTISTELRSASKPNIDYAEKHIKLFLVKIPEIEEGKLLFYQDPELGMELVGTSEAYGYLEWCEPGDNDYLKGF